MKVVIASTNPVKIEATKRAFHRLFPDQTWRFEGVDVLSGVNDQPMSDAETLTGAKNRVKVAARQRPRADYWVGIEGGSQARGDDIVTFAWIVVKHHNQISRARTSEFFQPDQIKILMRQGLELKRAADKIFNTTDSGKKTGAIGLLTNNAVTRTDFYEQAVILALVRFLKPELYNSTA